MIGISHTNPLNRKPNKVGISPENAYAYGLFWVPNESAQCPVPNQAVEAAGVRDQATSPVGHGLKRGALDFRVFFCRVWLGPGLLACTHRTPVSPEAIWGSEQLKEKLLTCES